MGKLFKGGFYAYSTTDPLTSVSADASEIDATVITARFGNVLSLGDNGLTDFSVTDQDSEEAIGGDGPQGHVLTGHNDATFTCSMNAGTTGSNALMRVHGSNRPVWFIKADDGNEAGNKATVYKVNTGTTLSGGFKGIVKMSAAGNVAEDPREFDIT